MASGSSQPRGAARSTASKAVTDSVYTFLIWQKDSSRISRRCTLAWARQAPLRTNQWVLLRPNHRAPTINGIQQYEHHGHHEATKEGSNRNSTRRSGTNPILVGSNPLCMPRIDPTVIAHLLMPAARHDQGVPARADRHAAPARAIGVRPEAQLTSAAGVAAGSDTHCAPSYRLQRPGRGLNEDAKRLLWTTLLLALDHLGVTV